MNPRMERKVREITVGWIEKRTRGNIEYKSNHKSREIMVAGVARKMEKSSPHLWWKMADWPARLMLHQLVSGQLENMKRKTQNFFWSNTLYTVEQNALFLDRHHLVLSFQLGQGLLFHLSLVCSSLLALQPLLPELKPHSAKSSFNSVFWMSRCFSPSLDTLRKPVNDIFSWYTLCSWANYSLNGMKRVLFISYILLFLAFFFYLYDPGLILSPYFIC